MRIIGSICIGIGISLTSNVGATDSFNSEFSHATAGAVVAGVSTAVADRFWPENRALVGFGVGVAGGVMGELFDGHGRTTWEGRHSTLDVLSTAIGAGIGAWGTDRFILRPVVKREQVGPSPSHYYGVVGQYSF